MEANASYGQSLFEEASFIMENVITFLSFVWMFLLLLTILACAGKWFTFKKIGRKGYEAIIPFHNTYEIIKVSGLPGWYIFLMQIPLYGIYINIKIHMTFAQNIGKSKGFGIGLALLPFIFFLILGADKRKSFFRDPSERYINTANAADGNNNKYLVDNFTNVETFNSPQMMQQIEQNNASQPQNQVQYVNPTYIQPNNNLVGGGMQQQSMPKQGMPTQMGQTTQLSQSAQQVGQTTQLPQMNQMTGMPQMQNQFMNNPGMQQQVDNSTNIFDLPNNQT